MVLSGDKRKFCRCAVAVSTAKVVHALVHFGVEHPTPNTIRSTNQGHSESTAARDTGNDLLDRFAIFVFERVWHGFRRPFQLSNSHPFVSEV